MNNIYLCRKNSTFQLRTNSFELAYMSRNKPFFPGLHVKCHLKICTRHKINTKQPQGFFFPPYFSNDALFGRTYTTVIVLWLLSTECLGVLSSCICRDSEIRPSCCSEQRRCSAQPPVSACTNDAAVVVLMARVCELFGINKAKCEMYAKLKELRWGLLQAFHVFTLFDR